MGLAEARVSERLDCFGDTSPEVEVAKDLREHAVNFFARKAAV